MINLTREEVINILKAMSRIDGYLFSVEGHGAICIAEQLEYSVELLADKLKNETTVG